MCKNALSFSPRLPNKICLLRNLSYLIFFIYVYKDFLLMFPFKLKFIVVVLDDNISEVMFFFYKKTQNNKFSVAKILPSMLVKIIHNIVRFVV